MPMEGVKKEQVEIPTRDGANIPALVYKPEVIPDGSPAPLAVLYHGGGHVMGIPEMEENNAMTLVRNHGCVAVSVGYRLAPEHQFPIPVHDSWDAFKWVSRFTATWQTVPYADVGGCKRVSARGRSLQRIPCWGIISRG